MFTFSICIVEAMLWSRVLPGVRRAGARLYGAFHDPIDHVTGIEKRELLAHLAGDCDPFRMLAIKRGKEHARTNNKL